MQINKNRIRLALQKNGRLSEESFNLIARCGIKVRKRQDELFCHSENFPLDLLFVRDDDIPGLVMEGVCDLGMVGTNVLQEKILQRGSHGYVNQIEEICSLDFAACQLSIAVPEDFIYENKQNLTGCRIATSYPFLLQEFLQKNQVNAKIVTLTGSIEIAPRLGIADAICDVVVTGVTLESNNLRRVETIFDSKAVLIQSQQNFSIEKKQNIQWLQNRLCSVLQATGSKYIMLHVAKNALDKIVSLLPGVENPTIMQLQGDINKVAVHALCRENIFWETLEKLKAAGASAILLLPVEKMLM